MTRATRPVAFVLCALMLSIAPTAAQKITIDEIMKPYDAKARPDYVPPASSTPTRSWWPRFTSQCRCTGCGCKGGPGWRAQNGQCVSHANLAKDCGSPPSLRCTHEGARRVC